MISDRQASASGILIVFEGGEGAGKSTQGRLLADALRARGREVVLTREPGGTPLGEAVREVLLGAGSHGMAAQTEALLFAAARAEHAAGLIRPARERGAVVISDRYLDSSVAYQGAARGLGEERIAELSMWATSSLIPDLTVLLDVAPGVGLARAADANRMEAEPEEFHRTVRESFLRRAALDPGRYLVLPADGDRALIAAQVLDAVLALDATLTRDPAAPLDSAPIRDPEPAPHPVLTRDPALPLDPESARAPHLAGDPEPAAGSRAAGGAP